MTYPQTRADQSAMMHTLACGQVQTAYLMGKNIEVIHSWVNIITIVLNRLCKYSVRKHIDQ